MPNLFHIKSDPLGFLTKVGHRHGDMSTFLMWTQRGYLINHPRLIKDFLTKEQQDFEKAAWQMDPLKEVTGNGLLSSSGELWKRQRRLIQGAFRRGTLPQYARLSVEITEQYIKKWGQRSTVNLTDEMGNLTLATSIRNNFGIEPGDTSDRLAEAILEIADNLRVEMETILSLPEWVNRKYHARKRENLKIIDDFINQTISEKSVDQVSERFNVLYKLLEAIDEEGDGKGMDPKLARDEAMTMMIAGNHSVGATLTWIWTMLTRHPEVHRKVEQEILNNLGRKSATIEDLPSLPYLNQVVQETLRLYPSAWVLFCRRALRNTSVGNYRIKKGGWVFVVPFVTHRDERFFPNAMTFDPDRFSPERIDEIPQHAYFPFGNGPHVCIGKMMAMTQIPLMLATIVQHYKVQGTQTDQQIKIDRDLAIRPLGGTDAIVIHRDQAQKSQPIRGSRAA